ncbi:hypothetical protein DEIPH_ctg008orf0095 [Deinococcus phoenicis]|uniref:Uncharacterized protein n=1 Tax=Deinococcus phoenicis TaxID=1476583 RepID=A0A016QU93_9DEIO|nr:hypothetical protein [Deinococcus phoenicis]EYB69369.1 hypothetical protein DEIPH_ctg008orf0095 [Deinococcus phoenicis]
MKPFSAATLFPAILAALLWMGIGTVQRTRAGLPLADALVAELPLTVLVFVLALVWAALRRRR